MSVDPPPAGQEPKRRLRNGIKIALKLGVAVGLLAWLFFDGSLDFDKLGIPFQFPVTLTAIVLGGALSLSLSGLRWWLLLGAEGIKVPLPTAVRLTWIGHFWNMVIPGAVSGDLVKMFYVGRLVPEAREESWTTVLVDRVIGLTALVSLSAVASFSRLEFVLSRPELTAAFVFMVLVLAGAGVGVVVLALGVGVEWRVTAWARGRFPKLAHSVSRFYGTLRGLLRSPGRLAAAFGISLGAHCITVGYGSVFGALFTDAFDATEYCALIPIALFSNAIPVSPGGIGVGEKVLGSLLTWAGAGRPVAPATLASAGVSVIIWIRLTAYSLAAVGGLLYAVYRQPASKPQDPASPPEPPQAG